MLRRFLPTPPQDDPDDADATPSADPTAGRPAEPSLAALPVVGFTRRRMAILLGTLLIGWIVIVFARQVSEAAAATGRAEAMVISNDQRREQVAALERELDKIGDRRFILQQARGYGLGGAHEIPFSLAAGAPSLPPNAPGSASVRLGAQTSTGPLERWLTLLFGPGD
ncbi:MAG TPA: hypothetical protein VF119_01150 [Candidatus Limnocylindrales bacterium]